MSLRPSNPYLIGNSFRQRGEAGLTKNNNLNALALFRSGYLPKQPIKHKLFYRIHTPISHQFEHIILNLPNNLLQLKKTIIILTLVSTTYYSLYTEASRLSSYFYLLASRQLQRSSYLYSYIHKNRS